MSVLQVLVVDDEPAVRQVLASHVRKAGHEVDEAECGSAALARLSQGDVDVAICDIQLPDFDGIEVVRRARTIGSETSFIMITAFSSVDTAIEAMKAGAFDYLVKPLRKEDILRRLAQITDLFDLRAENRRLRDLVESCECPQPSLAMQSVTRLIGKVARTDGTILITGESGTGKTHIARKIHQQSLRSTGPFVSVNCGAIPEALLESEFFGHAKGAFTGADRATKGLFVEAHEGTLFLDEIGELPRALQVKLLDALEQGEVRPVGSENARRVDTRIIAATNCDIAKMVADGTFREDLYYRLNVLQIHIPPLRERREDIETLIDFFLRIESRRLDIDKEPDLDPVVDEMLQTYHWPGNLRQLRNVIARALILADDARITVNDIQPEITMAPAGQGGDPGFDADGGSLRAQVRRFETQLIQKTIAEYNGDRPLAAKQLGIALSTLYRKLEDLSPEDDMIAGGL